MTVLNIREEPLKRPDWIEHVNGDALNLPFQDQAFDVLFSNSVIEHVPDQAKMAAEIVRVGNRYFVQTPNRNFPIEPHYHVPMFQFLPMRVRAGADLSRTRPRTRKIADGLRRLVAECSRRARD